MKILDGAELASFIKERQAAQVRSIVGSGGAVPTLLILRDSDNPVIKKYVDLKVQYGEDIGVKVIDKKVASVEELKKEIFAGNENPEISGIIVQLPLLTPSETDEVTKLIAPEKDVDGLGSEAGLGGERKFDGATATAINWLLAGYDIDLAGKKIAIVGYGKLVGKPLARMWEKSGLAVTVFRHDDDLQLLADYDVIVSATGVAHLIKPEMVKAGAVVVDAGTASEDGVLVGDIDDAVRERTDLAAITPRVGGVGPLTVSALFDGVVR